MIDSYIEIDLTGVENPCKNYIIGNSGENYSRTLKIKLSQEYLNYSIYLEFRREDGEKYQTPYLDFSEEIIYKIPKVVMVADKIVLSIKAVDDKSTASILLFEKTFCVVATQTMIDDDDNFAEIIEDHDVKIIKIGSDLAEEIENRKKGDDALAESLENEISSEAKARENADNSLSGKLDTEISEVSEKVDSEVEKINGTISELESSFNEKVETILTDYATNTSVTEIKDDLEEKIDGVNSDLSTAKEEINASILVETTAREKGDADTLTSAKAYTDEQIATIDLSPYAKTETVETELAKKQNSLTAGQNVTLNNDTVSVDLSAYEKTADVDEKLAKKQDTLTAGDNVKIESNTVSVDLSAYAKTTDLSAYAKTTDLGIYATQTYVQYEIQAAVYDVMEASY